MALHPTQYVKQPPTPSPSSRKRIQECMVSETVSPISQSRNPGGHRLKKHCMTTIQQAQSYNTASNRSLPSAPLNQSAASVASALDLVLGGPRSGDQCSWASVAACSGFARRHRIHRRGSGGPPRSRGLPHCSCMCRWGQIGNHDRGCGDAGQGYRSERRPCCSGCTRRDVLGCVFVHALCIVSAGKSQEMRHHLFGKGVANLLRCSNLLNVRPHSGIGHECDFCG